MERLLRVSDICELYGLSEYEARNLMSKVSRVNVGNGTVRPRWRTTVSRIDAYLSRKEEVVDGLDAYGKLRRR